MIFCSLYDKLNIMAFISLTKTILSPQGFTGNYSKDNDSYMIKCIHAISLKLKCLLGDGFI